MMTDKKKEDDSLGSFYMGRVRPPPEPERKMPKGFLTAVTIAAFVGIVWYAYPQGQEKYTHVDVPVIAADMAPYKSTPGDPGGMEVPHQDSTVFDTLDKKSIGKPEKLLPKQEEPVDKKKLGIVSGKAQMKLDPETKPVVPMAEVKEEDVRTVAVKKQAEKPEAAPVAAAAVYIQLGAYKSEADAKNDWARLQKKHVDALKGLSMRLEKADLGAKGVFYRLQAGTPALARAKEICATLQSNKAACIVVK
jgi:cell division protein FtsN